MILKVFNARFLTMKSYLTLTNEERRAELEPLQAQYAKARQISAEARKRNGE